MGEDTVNELTEAELPYAHKMTAEQGIRYLREEIAPQANRELLAGAARAVVAEYDERGRELERLQGESAELRRELKQRRASVTTGGPPAPFTSRPPDEVVELSVAVPVSEEEAAALPEPCDNCGLRHPPDVPVCL